MTVAASFAKVKNRARNAPRRQAQVRATARRAKTFSPHLGYGVPLVCASTFVLQGAQLAVLLTLSAWITLVMVNATSLLFMGRAPRTPAIVHLGLVSNLLSVAIALFPLEMALPATGLYLGLGFCAGALLRPRELRWAVPVWTTVLLAAIGTTTQLPVSDPMWAFLMAGLLFAGSTMMGRSLLYGSIVAIRSREQARIDETLLRMTQDAALFRLTGGESQLSSQGIQVDEATPSESIGNAAEKNQSARDENERDLYQMVSSIDAFKDGLYRQLRLGIAHLEPADGFVYFLDASRNVLCLKEQCVNGDDHGIQEISASEGAIAFALQGGKAMRLSPEDPQNATHRSGQSGAQLLVPLRDQSGCIGLMIFDRASSEPFTKADERFANALATEFIHLAKTERILDYVESDRDQKSRILETARALSGLMQANDVVACTIQAVMQQADFDFVGFIEWSADQQSVRLWDYQVKAGEADHPYWAKKSYPFERETWVGQSLREKAMLPHVAWQRTSTSKPVLTQDEPPALAFTDLRMIPMTSRGRPIGALMVGTHQKGSFSRSLLEHIAVIADLAGVTFDGARMFDALTLQANTDGLTKLYNRRTLDRMLDNAFARSVRMKHELCVVLVDVDHFKKVNDTYGHQVGDEVLVEVARTLQTEARASDVVARYGGEEFCLVLEDTDGVGAGQLAERMRCAIKAMEFDTPIGPLSVTASFGMSTRYGSSDKVCDMLKRADEALYTAKENGRDRVVLSPQPEKTTAHTGGAQNV